MKSKNLSIRFIIQKTRVNKQGECPIYCRITFNDKRKEFSTGNFIPSSSWDSKRQEAKIFDRSNFINNSLYLIKKQLDDAHLKLRVNNLKFSIGDILNEYQGVTINSEKGFIEVYNLHSMRIKRLVGKDLKKVTFNKYLETGFHLESFIKWKFKSRDLPIQDIKNNFFEEFEYYLKTEKNFQQATINKAIQRIRKVVRYGIAEDFLVKDPFLLYKPKVNKKEVIFLTRNELKRLEDFEFQNERLEMHRELFIFCCYSGLGYKEMSNLKNSDISEGFDGALWINIFREKTGRIHKVPLLPNAKKILFQYLNPDSDLAFPTTQNPTFNRYLKDIARLLGIQKRLTHHIARKTFATTVLLYNDVPIEIVSKLLGHTKIQTTQEHYGEIVDKRVSEEMTRISNKLQSINTNKDQPK